MVQSISTSNGDHQTSDYFLCQEGKVIWWQFGYSLQRPTKAVTITALRHRIYPSSVFRVGFEPFVITNQLLTVVLIKGDVYTRRFLTQHCSGNGMLHESIVNATLKFCTAMLQGILLVTVVQVCNGLYVN